MTLFMYWNVHAQYAGVHMTLCYNYQQQDHDYRSASIYLPVELLKNCFPVRKILGKDAELATGLAEIPTYVVLLMSWSVTEWKIYNEVCMYNNSIFPCTWLGIGCRL